MMLKEKSNPWAKLKYLYILPVAAIAVTAFARPEISETAEEISRMSDALGMEQASLLFSRLHDISAAKVNDLTAIVEAKAVKTTEEPVQVAPVLKDTAKPVEVKYIPAEVTEKLQGTPFFEVVEQMPEYPGGMAAALEYIQKNMRYPETAKKNGTQGRVTVQFIIDKGGNVTDPKVIRAVDKDLDAEAIRLIGTMPKWKPGMQKGQAVAVKYTLPVMFRLEGGEMKSSRTVEMSRRPGSLLDSALVIVDGKEVTQSILNAINVDRIMSFSVLKDAASTAIYGARGAGGVILVTTKKGKIGKLSINARVNFGIETPIDLPDMLHTADFIDRKLAAGFPNNPNSGWDNPASLPDTDWEDLVWRNAFRQNYFLQMTGGNEKTTFNMSAEFYKNQFIERYSFEDAGNFRVASQTNISKRVKFSEILTVGFNNTDPHLYGQTNNDYVYYRQVPTMVPYDNTNEAGGGWGKHPAGGYYEGPNHVATLMSHHANERRFWARANAILDWEIINDLKFQANFSANFDSHANNLFLESWNLGSLSQQDYYSKDYGSGYDLRMLYTLTYDHTFGEKHYVKGMVGYEAYRATASSAGGWKNGFLVQPSDDISLGTGDKDVSGTKTEGRSLSQFARVNYAYDDRYLLEASIRRDGYDNFGPENRFGVFPSASVGWNVGKESFVKDNITWMSQLKLRGSYGKIGNNTIPQFLYEPSFTNNYLYYSYDGQNTQRGFWYSNVANATIKWEDVAQWNIGVDASFLDNRLNTTIEYYDKKTSDMLYSVGVPPSAGPSSEPFSETSSYRANIGKISNRGFEWMVQWRDSYKDFRYDVAFTLSTNKNKVVKLSDQVNPIIWAGSDAALNSSIYRTENGQPMGQMYGYVVDGIIQDQAEIDALNAQSPDGLYQQAGTAPGDLKYKDLNGDGKVTNEDKTYIGNPWPDLMYGLNINLSWKGFDLSMGWLGNAGVDVFNSAKLYERSFYGDYNTTYKVYEAWSPTNRATSHPRVTKEDPNGNFKNVSSYFVEDGSFFKLKNLHFGYNLPKSILSHLKIEGLKFYINCDNLFIITKFQGDPELGGGYLERNMYSVKRAPSTRTIMGGLSLTL